MLGVGRVGTAMMPLQAVYEPVGLGAGARVHVLCPRVELPAVPPMPPSGWGGRVCAVSPEVGPEPEGR